MTASLALLALLALQLHTAHGCAHTYTHDGGLVPPQGRRLMEANGTAAAPACGYTHVLAGRDWPESDDSCSWTCAGESQSPINVPLGADAVLSKSLRADLGFGTATNVRVLNLGHSVQVEFDAPTDGTASVAVAGDSVFGLYNATNPNTASTRRFNVQPLQFHFHSTSEHLVGGRSALLEFHLVTKLVATEGAGDLPVECPEGSDKMCLAVFGVLYDFEATDGDNVNGDPTIQQIIDNLPTCDEAGKECVKEVPGWELDLGSFFPNSRYQTYTGSLTTPPCSEGVIWHVFPTVKGSLSEKQLLDLQTALSASTLEGEPILNRANNRVTQPRNDRLVFASGGVSRRMF